jgi:hypothetical protein
MVSDPANEEVPSFIYHSTTKNTPQNNKTEMFPLCVPVHYLAKQNA